jgi:hypothetical protein
MAIASEREDVSVTWMLYKWKDFFFLDRFLLCSTIWPWTRDLPASFSPVLGSQEGTILTCYGRSFILPKDSVGCSIFFFGTGGLAQGLALARRALYHLSHALSPKAVVWGAVT